MLLARKASLDQIWTAATMHAKINRRKLDKLNITRIWYNNAVIFPENQSYIAMILEDAEEDSANIDLISQRKGQCTVLKTSTQQIVFQHAVVGLVYPEKLTSGDSSRGNKDTYLILQNLPSECDSRVKAVEVDETTEDYKDIGGLEKQLMQQIQELAEAVMLPMKHNERFQKLGVRRLKDILLYGPPETGKTLMALACSTQTNANFHKLAGSQLVQTVFLHVVDHVDPNKLTRGNPRVKDMEVDKEFMKSYSDMGGMEKQIQELVEEIILGLSGSPRKSSSSSNSSSTCDKDPFFKVPSPGKRLSKKQRTNDPGGDKEGDLEEEKGKKEIEGEVSDAKSILIYEKIEGRLVQVGEMTLVDTFGYFTFAKKMAGCYIGNPDDIRGKIPHALWPWPGYAIEYATEADNKMSPIWKDWEEFQAKLSYILARRNLCTVEEVPVTFKSVYDQVFDSSLQRRFVKGSLSFSYCVHFLWSSWLEEEPKSCQPPLNMVSTSKHSRWEIYYYDIERTLISFPLIGEMDMSGSWPDLEVDNDDGRDDEPDLEVENDDALMDLNGGGDGDKGKGKEKLEDGGKGEAKVSSSSELVQDYELSYSGYDSSDVDDDDPFRHESFCDFFGRLKFIEIVFTPQASEPNL